MAPPSSATVTTFHTFVAATRAKASEVGTNFSNFRGHSLPINADTQTSSDNTHDLGATDHRWRKAYLGNPPFVNSVHTGFLEIQNVYDGTSPPDCVDPIGDMQRVAFPPDLDKDVQFGFVVPPTFVPGSRIGLYIRGYSDTIASFVMEAVASLYKHSITTANLTTPSNLFTSTATVTPGSSNRFLEDSQLKLSNASGVINSLTFGVGDVINVNLKRKGTTTLDTSTGYWYLTQVMVDFQN